MEEKPMTVLSMEAIFQHMTVEKLWEIQKSNMALRRVINDIPPKKLQKQFPIRLAEVEGQIIALREGNRETNRTVIDGVSQTRWVSPMTLTLENCTVETIQKSFLPVATSFCKRMRSMEFTSEREESAEYFDAILKLLRVCPMIEAIAFHTKNLTEEQIGRAFDSLNLNRVDDEAKEFTISVSAGTEVTPALIEKYLKTAGTRRRTFMVTEGSEGETLKITNDAIKKIFMTVRGEGEPWGHEQKMIIERMERQRMLDLIEEFKVLFPTGRVEDVHRGHLAYWVFHENWNKGVAVLSTY